MNDQLKEKLLKYLDVLEEGAKKGGEFLSTEVPDTIQQWITFNMILSGTYMAIGLLILLGLGIASIKLWKAMPNILDKDSYDYKDNVTGCRVVVCIAAVVFSGFAAHFTVFHLEQLLLCWLAPNVFIIKELSALIH